MKHGKIICKTALVACVSLCLMSFIATSCRIALGKSAQKTAQGTVQEVVLETVPETVQETVSLENLELVCGTVLDETDNELLIGVTVCQEDNHKNSVATDINGKFMINVPAGAKLKVSCKGYFDAVVEARDSMTVFLKGDPKYEVGDVIAL